MKSVTVVTTEIDDARIAADELVAGVKARLVPAKNMFGILYYDYEMQSDDLIKRIKETYAMDIVGCSTIAALDGRDGYHEMAAVLTVVTADDCEFSAVLSESLTRENASERVLKAYDAARNKLAADPRLIFAMPPCGVDIATDHVLEALSERAEHTPIIGGVPSSAGTVEKSIVFNGKCYSDRFVLILISGNIQPTFSVGNVASELSDTCCTITKTEGTAIYEVDGDKTLAQFIEAYGIDVTSIVGKEDRTFFQKYPLLIKDGDPAEQAGTPYVRILSGLNMEDGSGTMFASVPEGAQATLAMLKREDIGVSAKNAMERLLAQISANEKKGCRYTTVFCISCAARHFIMKPVHKAEGNSIKSLLPETLELNGFYSYGEICPTRIVDGKATNRLHNASIVFCAV